MMKIKNSLTKAVILTIDDEGNLTYFNHLGQPIDKINVTVEEEKDADRSSN